MKGPDSMPVNEASSPLEARTEGYCTTPVAETTVSAVRVSGYRLLAILGRGGMGVVYKAVQEKANRLVALKMIVSGAHASPSEQLRFRAEAEAAARLSHPHIVHLYEVGETTEGVPFFSLEFVSGGTLASHLKQGLLRPAQAASLIEALARAMQYAHERGIVHRDLKPANILLEGEQESGSRKQESGLTLAASGEKHRDTLTKTLNEKSVNRSTSADTRLLIPKISDFGLAKQLDADDGMTRTGVIVGTPSYMAPEQAFGQSKNVGPAADIYALGAILYECLTGRPPFKGATVADTLDQVRTMEAIGVRALVRHIPADLETICLHCLHKDAARRYVSAEALAEDLRRFREGEAISVRPVSRFERGWRWCRRNPWLASMIGLATAALVAVAGIAVFAYLDAAARNVIIEKKREEAVAAQNIAKRRLEQSLQALGLFATDFRYFCEDALVPGKNKAKLYEVLIKQLESQTAEDVGEATEDSLRNKVWMYQTMAIVYLDTQQLQKAKATIAKGIEGAVQWVQLKPGDAYARSYHAALLSLKGDVEAMQNRALSRELYEEALKIRRELAGNSAVDQYTPGRSLMQLADNLDKLHQYDESLELREQTVKLHEDKGVDGDKLFESVDFWCWTCWKAYVAPGDRSKRLALLHKADELSRRVLKVRPGARRTLERWSGIARELGDQEYNFAKLAETKNDSAEAKKHADAALKHYRDLADIARQLAVAPDLMYSLRNYARSFYALGLMERNLGKHAAARVSMETSRHIREALLRDYANHPIRDQLRIDLLFSLVALGEHAQAVKEGDKIQSAPLFLRSPEAHNTLYRLACVYSLSAGSVEDMRRPSTLTDADKKLQAEYRDKALTALEQSYARGNRDFYTARFDADLTPIRSDPRFQRVLELEKKLNQ